MEQRDSEKRQFKKFRNPIKPLVQINDANDDEVEEDPAKVEIQGERLHR